MRLSLSVAFVLILHFGSRTCAAAAVQSKSGKDEAAAEAAERNLFAADIYNAVASDRVSDNVVISPAAIQTSLALACYGAKDKTALELRNGLRLGTGDAETIARRFGEHQQSFAHSNYVRLLNNIYINEELEFKGAFRDVAKRNFDTVIDKLDFHVPYNKRTAAAINREFESKTGGKISDIIHPDQLYEQVEGVIMNGITFTAPWQKAFKPSETAKRSFLTEKGATVQVETMWTFNNFRYAKIDSIDAKVIELPFQGGEFSMIVLLPNRDDGLRALQQQLVGKNLLAFESELSEQKVEVRLPKFALTFAVELKEPLGKLGVKAAFTRAGDFGNMYRMFVSHYINAVNHKAHVEFTEAGVEQPMSKGGLKSLFSSHKKFDANHPFIFAIKHQPTDSVLFMGHIADYVHI